MTLPEWRRRAMAARRLPAMPQQRPPEPSPRDAPRVLGTRPTDSPIRDRIAARVARGEPPSFTVLPTVGDLPTGPVHDCED